VPAALGALAPRIAGCFRDPWWIIGSTAAHLAAAPEIVPHDIDVLASARDVDAFAARHGDALDRDYRPGDGARFRSRFARFAFAPLPVELMGGLEVDDGRGWRAVRVGSTRMIDCEGEAIPLPTVAEQIRLFELFGRGKDLEKARILRRHARETTDAR
jgi:hypothetical protein